MVSLTGRQLALSQLRGLLIKFAIRKRRNCCWSIVELAIPVAVVLG